MANISHFTYHVPCITVRQTENKQQQAREKGKVDDEEVDATTATKGGREEYD